ncbi:MAG TPA: FGGY family carbohydrate kinase [Acidimicrobiales bacterium]|jgi:xylulokinase
MTKTYLGIDVGTSSTRVVLVRDDGAVLDAGTAPYPIIRRPHGIAEQDPTAWVAALRAALSEVDLVTYPPDAIGLCGQTPTVVMVDADGVPLSNALTWQDTRAELEAKELAHQFGDPESIFGTALAWSASAVPAKLKWIGRHQPDLVTATAFVLQPKDFIGMQLTGSPLSDPWSSKGLCRVTDGAPASDVLEACGWRRDVCPPIAPAWSERGVVSKQAAKYFGLRAGTPVTVGWSDALAEMLAAGCFAESSAFVFSGTSSIVGTAIADENVRAAGLYSVPRYCAPTALLYGPTQSGGSAFQWVARLLGCSVDELFTIAKDAGTSLPVFVPYLSGERAPLWDQNVRALFLGLSDEHGRAEIAMSVVLGVFLGTRHVLDDIERAGGVSIDVVDIAGRGVGDAVWEAAALHGIGRSLRFHQDPDLSARGAAVLAAAVEREDPVGASRLLSDEVKFSPRAERVEQLDRHLVERYREASEIALQWRASEAQRREGAT